ncbi:MAG: LLM class flavin-dependent oxidoreductase [Caulobacteraceae bacterium]|nr:LLM class flavin-dependent oxidoreductase [Caulobacteraceae bacterium]
MIPLSVLDLAPVPLGSSPGEALRSSRRLARHAEALGYRRFWMAEHHNMTGIASAATAVALAFVAEDTESIRLGAGGVMLPNHAPLAIAEQFGTLASLYPGRIDLGLGRAPGTDMATARALRRTLVGDESRFPRDVAELMAYFAPVEPGQQVQAVPGGGLEVPLWILGSSTYGAELAAAFGLPFAFASHFAPAMLDQALAVYRSSFRPSEHLQEPYVMLGLSVLAAPTDEEAAFLATSQQQSIVNLRTGRPGPIPPPQAGYLERLPPELRALIANFTSSAVVGSPETVRAGVRAFAARTRADELMIACSTFDPEARLRSYEMLAGTMLTD